MPFFSVITPTYNRAHLIGETIHSILNQTDPDFEHIIMDDGSEDETAHVVAGFRDPRVRYFTQANAGVSAARNSAVRMARGEILVFLDSDDLAQPDRLERIRSVYEADLDWGLVYGRYYGIAPGRSQGKLVGRCRPNLGVADLIYGTAFHWSTSSMRRVWFDRVGGFDERLVIGEEWDLTLRLALHGCKMFCVDRPLATARMQPTSLSRDLHRHAQSSRLVLEKTFSSPLFPEHLRSQEKLAYAVQRVQTAAAAFMAGEDETGAHFLALAVEEDPLKYKENSEVLAKRLVHYTGGLSVGSVEEVLSRACKHLPGSRAQAALLRRRIWGHFHADVAFQARRRGDWRKLRRHVLLAVWHMPELIKNRGLLAILLRSLWPTSLRRAA